MDTLYFIIQQTMFFSIPLLLVALGGLFSEKSGVSNVALDGMMIIGAFAGTFFIGRTGGIMSGQGQLMIALVLAAAAGLASSILLAFSSVTMKANQIIGGTAINMIAPALTVYIARVASEQGTQQVQFNNTFRIESVPVLGKIPLLGPMFFQNTYITTYIGFAVLFISIFVLYKTRFGLRLRACGEKPESADAAGVNVYAVRYAGVLISGILGGIGGLVFVVPTTTVFNHSVYGYGFLALAVLIFGQWEPKRILFASFFFGLLKAVSNAYSVIPALSNLKVPTEFYKIIPFICTLILLTFTSQNSKAPKASGVPYDKGKR